MEISKDRLEELAKLVCWQTHYEGFQCHICDLQEMASELLKTMEAKSERGEKE